MRNKQSLGGTSKYKGVCWCKRGRKWRAYINLNSKAKHLGRFESEKDAALAYNKAAKKHYGEFAFLNKITRDK